MLQIALKTRNYTTRQASLLCRSLSINVPRSHSIPSTVMCGKSLKMFLYHVLLVDRAAFKRRAHLLKDGNIMIGTTQLGRVSSRPTHTNFCTHTEYASLYSLTSLRGTRQESESSFVHRRHRVAQRVKSDAVTEQNSAFQPMRILSLDIPP